ncbi:MAG: glutamate-5-semialdehyde dehydrogenase [Anaerolineaceae bacterium]|nr:glutamate-5-semialdehyde dehydrogenase [Anaerolineaceae bacterium]
MNIKEICQLAKQSAKHLALLTTEKKNQVLGEIADQIWENRAGILQANAEDILRAEQEGLSEALIDRLRLDEARLSGIVSDVRKIISLQDPVGEVFDARTLDNGLRAHKQRVPIGVLAVIYEARPNVTIDVTTLALKSGNAVILRGGKETIRSNRAFVDVIHAAYASCGLPIAAVQFIDSPDRALVRELLTMYEYVDMLIPRGGAKLHRFCRENSMIPVITGGIGVCHLFVDESAKQSEAVEIIHNAKTQRPSVCNALDTILVHEAIAEQLIPRVIERLGACGVTFKVDALGMAYVPERHRQMVGPARPEDYSTEWLSLTLGIRVVRGLDEALEHIETHSTQHSDGILTEDQDNAEVFVSVVDSAAVYVNASTRFTDGAQLGLGAEVAVSTQRLHARGPMALEALSTYKWVIRGDYHVRQ